MKKILVKKWLLERYSNLLSDKPISIWLFGSLAADAKNPNDCDLLIVYRLDIVDFIVELSPLLEETFELNFKIPLHLTRISSIEIESCKPLLSRIFHRPHLPIYLSDEISIELVF